MAENRTEPPKGESFIYEKIHSVLDDMAMLKGVYAGSFDPPTNGHLWVIRRGAEMFDTLVVAVGVNSQKQGMFTIPERRHMLERMLVGYPNVEVASYDQFLVHFAESVGAGYILRGMRSTEDYQFESGMMQVNADINPNILTVFLIPPSGIAKISSGLVKGLAGPEGWEDVVRRYVPEEVYTELLRKSKANEEGR
jgi:pantetheine-phosphate adenylyltransferase